MLWLWERHNLANWDTGERAAFWVSFIVAFAWAVALEGHVHIPTLADLTAGLRPLWHEFLRQQPDIYW